VSKPKRPRRAIYGFILGIVGGFWTLSSYFLAGAFILAGILGGGNLWFMLGVILIVLPPSVTIISIIASVLILAKRYKIGGIINLVGSALVLLMFFLFVLGSRFPSSSMQTILASITFFWIGPFVLLLLSAICGLTAASTSRSGR